MTTPAPARCDRILRAGAFADTVMFDAAAVADRATFDAPVQPAAGIDLVMVNGTPVWRDRAATGARPGLLLHRAGILTDQPDRA